MSGGGTKPRGGKMGTSIRATSVSPEAVTNAENELSAMVEKLGIVRQKMADAVRLYQVSEKTVSHLEMDLAKCQKEVLNFFITLFQFCSSYILTFLFKQIDSLKTQHGYLEKQLDSMKAASEPRKDELDRLEELSKIIHGEEKEIERLTEGSKQVKEKVQIGLIFSFSFEHHYCVHFFFIVQTPLL